MSDYGCCILSICVYEDMDSCEDCPYYDDRFFEEVAKDEEGVTWDSAGKTLE